LHMDSGSGFGGYSSWISATNGDQAGPSVQFLGPLEVILLPWEVCLAKLEVHHASAACEIHTCCSSNPTLISKYIRYISWSNIPQDCTTRLSFGIIKQFVINRTPFLIEQ
jgi:hypothetical protein